MSQDERSSQGEAHGVGVAHTCRAKALTIGRGDADGIQVEVPQKLACCSQAPGQFLSAEVDSYCLPDLTGQCHRWSDRGLRRLCTRTCTSKDNLQCRLEDRRNADWLQRAFDVCRRICEVSHYPQNFQADDAQPGSASSNTTRKPPVRARCAASLADERLEDRSCLGAFPKFSRAIAGAMMTSQIVVTHESVRIQSLRDVLYALRSHPHRLASLLGRAFRFEFKQLPICPEW